MLLHFMHFSSLNDSRATKHPYKSSLVWKHKLQASHPSDRTECLKCLVWIPIQAQISTSW